MRRIVRLAGSDPAIRHLNSAAGLATVATRSVRVNIHAAALTLPIVALALLFAACGKKAPVVQPPPEIRTVTVEVPTIVKAIPPPELLAPIKPPLPTFISPFDPDATSALTADGERILRALIEEILQRLKAWEVWAKSP